MKNTGEIKYPDFELLAKKYEDGKKYWTEHVREADKEWSKASEEEDVFLHDPDDFWSLLALLLVVGSSVTLILNSLNVISERTWYIIFGVSAVISVLLLLYKIIYIQPRRRACDKAEDAYFKAEEPSYEYGWEWDQDDYDKERTPIKNNKYEFILWLKAIHDVGIKNISLVYDMNKHKYTIEIADPGKEATLTFWDMETIDTGIVETFDFTCLNNITFSPLDKK